MNINPNEEAHYWFSVNDVADYVEIFGVNKVLSDVLSLINKRSTIKLPQQNDDQDFSDVPF